jgi:F-type H+-transporting ATPase subunit b
LRAKILSLLLTLLPSVVLLAGEGAEGHGEEGGWMAPIWGVPTIAWQIVNVLLVVVLFVYLLRRPAPEFFAGRAREIQELLERALRDKEEALLRLKEVDEKMARLSEEVAAIEKAAREAAEADRAKVAEEAEAAKVRIREEAVQEMERQLVQARRELKAYAADLAIQAAREILAKNLSAEDEARIQDRFLTLMEESHGRRG